MAHKWINKVGLAATCDGKLLVVRKQGQDVFILPGGKPERDELELDTLRREVMEELGCEIANPYLRGVFTDLAAGEQNAYVVVRLYSADLIGQPLPQMEIEELAWIDLRRPGLPLAPSISNYILPKLNSKKRKSRSQSEKNSEMSFELG